MNKSITIHLLFIFLMAFTACQSDSKSIQTTEREVPSMKAPEAIQAQYYVRYVADEQELKAEASFLDRSKDKEKKSLTFNGVLLNNNPMQFNQANKKRPHYKLQKNGLAESRMAFQFITEQGTKEEDIVYIPSMEDFSFGKKMSRSKPGSLRWKGDPLDEKESLVLLFTNKEGRTTSTILNGPTEGTQIAIPAKNIQNLEPGVNSVYIVRKNRFLENKKGNDGASREVRALTEYYSNTIEVTVVK